MSSIHGVPRPHGENHQEEGGEDGRGGRGGSVRKKILLRAKNFFLLQSTGRRGYYCANYTEILVSSSSYPS